MYFWTQIAHKMKYRLFYILLLLSKFASAQPTPMNSQMKYDSDSRTFYVWNDEKDAYDLRDTEFENSMINIREIGSKNNGYIVISLVDDAKVRTYHGSIISYNVDEKGLSTWIMRSKTARGKLVLDPSKKTFTYSYESNEKRYVKIFIFNIKSEEAVND